ncbi:MAG TPA: ABC transporter permease [Stellaceae bacterium]|nr:ABC transporter permease [Stellaceae bacterium]
MKQVPVLWLLWPVLLVLAVFFAAFGYFVADSFLHQIPGTAMMAGPVSLENYRTILGSVLVQRIFVGTLWISCKITLAATLLGYPLAYLLARTASARVRQAILFLLVVTFLSGGITRAYAWMILLGNNGPINRSLRDFGYPPLALLNNETGVLISLVHFVIPFFVLTLFGTIKNIPMALEEAARNLGGRRWRAFTSVTLPLSLPGLVSAMLLTFTVTVSSFLFPLLLGGGRVQMAANLIYDKMENSFDMPVAATISILFLLVSLVPLSAFSLLRMGLGRRFGGTRR